MKKYKFDSIPVPPEIANDPQLKLIDPILLSVIYKRGYRTVPEIMDFLTPDKTRVMRSYTMTGTDVAVQMLEQAIRNNDHIVIYRDYDCDGISAGAIAMECLSALGAYVDHYANQRSIDGYGMCPAGVDSILAKWPDTKIVLTVDNGISAHDGIRYAKGAGLRVIVTDHHEAGTELPPADVIIDPKQPGEIYPFKHLCGAGVIFKLMLALYAHMGKHIAPVMDTIDIVALATVADVVPLVGENRALVKMGLEVINEARRPFFAAMLAKSELKNLNAHYGVSFVLAPMVNSVSRLDEDTEFVVKMMLSNDPVWLSEAADRLIEMNEHRKEITKNELELLEVSLAEQTKETDTAIIVRNDKLTEGVIGILAGRLKQRFNRPCIVFTKNEAGELKGSARGCDGFELKASLDALPSGTLTSYGGHTKAAGLTLLPDKYDTFRREFMKLTDAAFQGSDFAEESVIDEVLSESTCTKEFIHDLQYLEPFGEGFRPPLFGLVANVVETKYMGIEQQHVKYITERGISVIQWNRGDAARARKAPPKKFVGSPSLNVWHDITTVQFICDDP